MAKVQYLTIAQAEVDKNPSLWVVNTSTMSDAEIFGDVIFNVPRLAGQGDPARVKVGRTWLPQDLNEQVSKEQILRSVEFRQAVIKNLVAIVSQSYAESVMVTSAARTERRRLEDERKAISRAAGTTRTLADSGTEVYSQADLDNRRHGNKNIIDGRDVLAGDRGHESYGVSEAFYGFAKRLDGMSDGQAINELRARPTMKRSEMRCVIAHLSNDHNETRDYITGRLARMDAKKAAKAAKLRA